MSTTDIATAQNGDTIETVILETPIERGTTKINEIVLRKPLAGALRGTSLQAIIELDVDALAKVLPRISTPSLTVHDVYALDPVDLIQLGSAFAGFLAPKALLARMASQQP